MLVIIEGVTCSGKSTLTTRLQAHLEQFGELRLMHKSRPEVLTRRWVLHDYTTSLADYQPAGNYSVLADRWHFGETTYGTLYRPKLNLDGFGLLGIAGWRWVELFLLSRGAYVIQLEASDETLIQRLHDRGDDDVKNVQELLTLSDLYRSARSYSVNVKRVINTSDIDAADLDLDEIYFEALREEALTAEVLAAAPEYTGNLRPDVLLVGDQRNITKAHGAETTLPFMPVASSSGIYLLESLPEDFWSRIGMINGNDMTGDLRELWEVLGRPRPVALGRRATAALARSGFDKVEYTSLDHPAYTRRFKHFTQAEYGQSIVEAASRKGIYA